MGPRIGLRVALVKTRVETNLDALRTSACATKNFSSRLQTFNYSRGGSDCEAIWWNGLCDEAAGADYGARPNLDTLQNSDIHPQPNIVVNDHGFAYVVIGSARQGALYFPAPQSGIETMRVIVRNQRIGSTLHAIS